MSSQALCARLVSGARCDAGVVSPVAKNANQISNLANLFNRKSYSENG
jgi:hypothetical protein